MKHILIALMMTTACCTVSFAQKTSTGSTVHTVVTNQSANAADDSVYTPTYIDTDANGITVESESTDSDDSYSYDDSYSDSFSLYDDFGMFKEFGKAATVGVTFALFMLILIFGFPILILFLAFYFRHKSQRERYRLIEKAIESGQPIPESFLKESMNKDTTSKGIKNMCLGAGLFFFLWAITDSLGMGCIGLLIFFTGLGQWLVARNQRPTDNEK